MEGIMLIFKLRGERGFPGDGDFSSVNPGRATERGMVLGVEGNVVLNGKIN